ncbi:MAG: hypothetical protein H8D45_10260 [Bacteroidetes bacterium]|nr:hypothetical protein [Bacteroidota bacterium]MBL7105104.1 hypothetical protein [Bacteroidales bacterium]
MKTFLKIIGILVIIIIALTFILPVIFKGKIFELAKEEINKNVRAKVDFTDLNLSLFKSFPNFTLSLKGLTAVGNEEFEKDTLANIQTIDITIGLFSVIGGDNYEIKRIRIIQPDILVKILEDGKANYDIAVQTEEEKEPEITTEEEESAFAITLKRLEITNANIIYADASQSMTLKIIDLDHTLMGNLSEDFTTLRTNTTIGKLTFNYDGINYLNNARLKYKANIDADLKNEIYTIKKNELRLNELYLNFDGSVSMINDDINLVLTFNTPKTEFKHLLSLVPAIYAKDFENIETKGSLSLDGNVKGIYNENNLPSFNLNLSVDNAMFKYPDLPKAVTDINVQAKIANKGGVADNTIIDISKFHLKLGSNPVDISMLIKTPVSDPEIDGKIKGKLDLASVKDYYPLDKGEELSGTFLTNITLQGKMSSIENEQYEDFTAIGSMLVKGLKYKSGYVNEPVEISNAQLNFSPQYLDLVSFKSKIGKNDFNAKGKLRNYIAYVFKDGKLKGELETTSKYFNVSALMPKEEEIAGSPEISSDSVSMSVIEVPANIEFYMDTKFNELLYDNIEMENVSGQLEMKDKRVVLKNLRMNLLEGTMRVNGTYSTVIPENPAIDLNLDLNQIDIQQAYNTFSIISEYAPIAKKTSGKFSVKMNLKSALDKEMEPIYETMNGGGELSTSRITIKDVNTLNKIADALKFEKIKSMVIDKILFQFKFVDGKILIEPFDIKYENIKANLGGWTGFDQSIDYVMNLNIPRKEFGSAANNVLNNLVNEANKQGADFSLGETVSLDVLIGGTLSNPEIKTGLKESGKNIVEDVIKQVEEEIKKKQEEITKQAREQAQKILDDADKQAKKVIQEAKKQAENIRKNANDAAQKLRDEADKQAKQIEQEGKKKGFLAEAAAKESAKKIRSEANKQANNLTNEADKQANTVVNKANKEADNIRKKAQEEADKLLGR